jgi:hypothetical protein
MYEFVGVIDGNNDRITVLVQLREQVFDRAGSAESRRSYGRRHRADACKQGQPEALFVFLATRRNEDHAICALQARDPTAQQRRLAAAGWRRNERHTPFEGSIQGNQKPLAVDKTRADTASID